VLKSVSFTVPAGTKVGVCGRTGSGKSSLVMALLRLNQIVSGDMKVRSHCSAFTYMHAQSSLLAADMQWYILQYMLAAAKLSIRLAQLY
jgi:ATP-binding cassette, subfamily C (CFTR/MRP), member 1